MPIIVFAAVACSVFAAGRSLAGQMDEKKITLSVVDVELPVVLGSIFDQARVSYALSGDVKGRTTLHVNGQTLKQVLTTLLSPLGLGATESDGVYLVEKVIKPKPEPSTAMPQELVIVEKEAPVSNASSTVSTDANLSGQPAVTDTATAYDDQTAPPPQTYQTYAPYPVFYGHQLPPGMSYNPYPQIPGVVLLPQFYPLPLVIGQQPWNNSPLIYGSPVAYYNSPY